MTWSSSDRSMSAEEAEYWIGRTEENIAREQEFIDKLKAYRDRILRTRQNKVWDAVKGFS